IPAGDAAAMLGGLSALTVNQALRDKLLAAGYAMPASLTVTSIGTDLWLVDAGVRKFVFRKTSTAALEVHRAKLVVDAVTYASKLDARQAGGLVGDFTAAGLKLTSGATVSVVTAGQTWTITDGAAKYTVQKQGSKLLVNGGNSGSMSDLQSVVRIEAGARIFSTYTSQNSFYVDADIIFTTDGKFVVSGTAVVGNNLRFNAKLYADLSKVAAGQGKFVFLADLPQSPRVASVYGLMTFGLLKGGDLVDPRTLPAGQVPDAFQIAIDGGASVTAAGFQTVTLDGHVVMTFSGSQFDLDFNANVSLEGLIPAKNLVQGAGHFVLDYANPSAPKLWGAAKLELDGSKLAPLAAAGINLTGDALLRINTDAATDHDVDVDMDGDPATPRKTFTIPAGSLGVFVSGTMGLHKGPVDADLTGGFAVEVKQDRLDVFAIASLQFAAAGVPLFQFSALGLIVVDGNGFAARLYLERDANVALPGGISFDGSMKLALVLNSTDRQYSYTIPSGTGFEKILNSPTALTPSLKAQVGSGGTVVIPARVPKVNADGTLTEVGAPGPYLVVAGSGHLGLGVGGVNVFSLDADLQFQAARDGVVVQVDGQINLGGFGNVSASGYLSVTAAGTVASIRIQRALSTAALSLSGAAYLEVNTTGSDAQVQQYTFDRASGKVSDTKSLVVIPKNTTRLGIDGRLSLASAFDVTGSFDFAKGPGYLSLEAHGKVGGFFGDLLSVDGNATFYDDSRGLQLDVGATLSTPNLKVGGLDLFKVRAALSVQVNTGTGTFTGAYSGKTITGGTYQISLSGDVTVVGQSIASASATITYSRPQNLFTINGTFGASLFGIASATVTLWANSRGQFDVRVDGSIELGDTDIVGFKAGGYFEVYYKDVTNTGRSDFGVLGGFGAGLYIAGIEVVGGGADVRYDTGSGDLKLYAYGKIFGKKVGRTLTVAHLTTPPPTVYLVGGASGGQTLPNDFAGGVLYLNIGARAGNRNGANGSAAPGVDRNETVYVDGDAGSLSNGRQTVTVTINGVSQTFKNVTGVVGVGNGRNTFNLGDGLRVPSTLTGGTGSTFNDLGLGGGTFTGSAGADSFFLGGGSTVVYGNGGSDVVLAGTGAATINTGTGAGSTNVAWDLDAALGDLVVNGRAADVVNVTARNAGQVLRLGQAGGALLVNKLGAANAVTRSARIAGVTAVGFTLTGGGNTVGVGDLSATPLTALDLDLGNWHTAGNGVSFAGSAAADRFTLDTTTVGAAPAVLVNRGGLNVRLINASRDVGDNLSIDGGGGNDAFLVRNVAIATTLTGAGSANAVTPFETLYDIGYRGDGVGGSLSGIRAPLSIRGSAGTDRVIVDDAADLFDRTFAVTAAGVVTDALGPNGTLGYDAAIDALDVRAGGGGDRFTVGSLAAATTLRGNDGDDAFTVSGPLARELSVAGGNHGAAGDTLSVSGSTGAEAFVIDNRSVAGNGSAVTFTGIEGLAVAGNGGNDAFTLNGNAVPTTITGGAGDDTVVVNASSAPTSIDTAGGNDRFTVNANSAPLTLTAHDGNATFDVNGNSAALTLNGATGNNACNVNANSGSLTVRGNGKTNAYAVNANSGQLSIATVGGGTSTYAQGTTSSPVRFDAGSGQADVHVTAPLLAALNLVGSSAGNSLTVDGTEGDDVFTITATTITGAGAGITYSGFLGVTINGLGGNDAFTVDAGGAGAGTPITLNGGLGDDAFYLRATAGPVAVDAGEGTNSTTVGSRAGGGSGRLDGVLGPVTITGGGTDTLTVDDRLAAAGRTLALTENLLAGANLPAGGIRYAGLANLNLLLGSGADAVTVDGTAGGVRTTVDTAAGNDLVNVRGTSGPTAVVTGTGTNTVNVGSTQPDSRGPAGKPGVLQGVKAALSITGGGADTLNLDDAGDTGPQTVVLTPTAVSLDGTAAITYAGVGTLNFALGSGANALTVTDTAAGAQTNVTLGPGTNDVAVRGTTGGLLVKSGGGTNTVVVGSAGAGPTLDGIRGQLTLQGDGAGNGTDAVTIDDSGDATGRSVTLAAGSVAGLTPAAISYAGLSSLALLLGTGVDTVGVATTAVGTQTTVDAGRGNDAVTVLDARSPLTVLGGAGDDAV
ncbi:MAG TPA: hypothetical protein VF796_24800, partial [Humisphaera sp.]